MRTVNLNSWQEFRGQVSNIESEFGHHERAGRGEKNRILYRGQSDANWELETTLERYSREKWSVESYVALLKRLKPQIESFSDQQWKIPKVVTWGDGTRLPCHELWVYLRHCGFPSPLLDWTLSPYVAAFFAFEQIHNSERVAVFAYIDAPRGTKVFWEKEPHISVKGVYEKTHRRHFLQQSHYTVCTNLEQNSNMFNRHEDVFRGRVSNSKRQDALIKITTPLADRKSALQELDQMNINRFSLFQSEEALMETLAFREIYLKTNPIIQLGSRERDVLST
jgi:hypothetical protein